MSVRNYLYILLWCRDNRNRPRFHWTWETLKYDVNCLLWGPFQCSLEDHSVFLQPCRSYLMKQYPATLRYWQPVFSDCKTYVWLEKKRCPWNRGQMFWEILFWVSFCKTYSPDDVLILRNTPENRITVLTTNIQLLFDIFVMTICSDKALSNSCGS